MTAPDETPKGVFALARNDVSGALEFVRVERDAGRAATIPWQILYMLQDDAAELKKALASG